MVKSLEYRSVQADSVRGAFMMKLGRLRSFGLLGILVWAVCCLSATAAKVNLVNGKQLTGKLVGEDEQSVQLLVGGVTVSLFKSEVVSLVDDQGRVRVMKGSEAVASTAQESPAPRTASPGALQVVEKVEPLLPVVRPAGQSHIVQADALNVRQGPGADFEKIGAVSKETVLIELGRQGAWLRVRLPNGSEGWVSSRYVKPLQDEPVLCTGQSVNFRQGPGLNHRILRKLDEQEVLLLLRRVGDWVQLRDAEGTIGWASANYVAELADPSALRPQYTRLAEEAVAAGVFEQSEPIAGSEAQTVRLSISDAEWISGGKVVLVLVAPQAEVPGWEALIQGKDIVSKISMIGEEAAAQLGLGPALEGDVAAVQRVVLKGYLKGQSWVFEYRRAQPVPTGLQRLLVGQRGARRGVVLAL